MVNSPQDPKSGQEGKTGTAQVTSGDTSDDNNGGSIKDQVTASTSPSVTPDMTKDCNGDKKMIQEEPTE